MAGAHRSKGNKVRNLMDEEYKGYQLLVKSPYPSFEIFILQINNQDLTHLFFIWHAYSPDVAETFRVSAASKIFFFKPMSPLSTIITAAQAPNILEIKYSKHLSNHSTIQLRKRTLLLHQLGPLSRNTLA